MKEWVQLKCKTVIIAVIVWGQLTQLYGDVDPEMRIVVYHSSVVVPKQEQGILDVVEHSARQSQSWARLQIFFGRAGDLSFRFGHLKLNKKGYAGMGWNCTLIGTGVPKLNEFYFQLPILEK